MKRKPPEYIPPEAPGDLSPRAQGIWKDSLADGRIKSAARQSLLYEALRSLDRADECRELLAEQELAATTRATGAVHLNPLVKAEREARQLYAKLLAQVAVPHR
jgi:hypothetical protein